MIEKQMCWNDDVMEILLTHIGVSWYFEELLQL